MHRTHRCCVKLSRFSNSFCEWSAYRTHRFGGCKLRVNATNVRKGRVRPYGTAFYPRRSTGAGECNTASTPSPPCPHAKTMRSFGRDLISAPHAATRGRPLKQRSDNSRWPDQERAWASTSVAVPNRHIRRNKLEARAGIEPACADLQSAT
jgi:hypothetical protein